MRPEALALLAAGCWAVSSLFSAPPAQRLGAFAFSRWRMLFASLLLWALAASSGGWRSLDVSALGLLAISGLIGIFIGDTALFACMNRLGPRRSGVLFACHALFSGVLAWVWLGEVLWGWALLGSLLLVGGVMLAIVWGKRSDESHHWEQTRGRLVVGVCLGLLAALCQSVATLMLKPLMSTGIDAVAASAVRMTLALAAHGLLWLLWRGARAQAPVRWHDAWLTFLSAAVAMALGMTLILKAMHLGQAGLVAVLSSVTPVLILPLLWLAYRRRPAMGAWWGAALAVLGTALILR
ncbi:MAG: DMT family transporter [Hydrogenophaga sp.]|uniref:DMT family transporter n=1 Tax=Hydrogenophaga sp. TaxID=1904254 RepID=UPI001BBF561D|nr:DMT family transporter [Hydrogenophaga sp.]MBS3912051.1 DMT family transporter [Hydrogenophaga sp.]MDO9147617.1 DMT family transporter [Hydrogenophaga sp.]MDO9605670.1 DMT family transporter [Hydrogenophaga sp.]MDP2163643.1 DMT family transporter [Hydrogenophaga sp.]MDP3476011.1 DMT family transporter [Hydrogenophaga sp.]